MKRRFLLALSGLLAVERSAHSQPLSYPERPVHWILGFAPGGSGDSIARVLAERVAALLSQPVVIDNKPGAGTNIASEFVARAPGDGYAILFGGSFSHAVNPALFAKLRYDPKADFVAVAMVARGTTVFTVPKTLPVNTLQEFITYARREGDKVNYASAGIGSPGHIAGAYFSKVTGLSMTHVPYKGSSESIRALVAGEIQLAIISPTSAMPLVNQGQATALALTTRGRSRVVPGVPGCDEAGLENFDLDGWYGLWAPRDTRPEVVAALHRAVTAALREPAIVSRIEAQGFEATPLDSPTAFRDFVEANAAYWADVVRQSGARID